MTRSLADVLARLSEATGELEVCDAGVRAAAEALGATACVLLHQGTLAASYGLPADAAAAAALVQGAAQDCGQVTVPGIGELGLTAAVLNPESSTRLVVARGGESETSAEAIELLNGIACALRMKLRGQLHDPLTGLPNRVLMRDRTRFALERVEQGDGSVAILFVDLDHFKRLNDSLDHRRGDVLLLTIAQRLSAIASLPGDRPRRCILGRQGGDEFIVLCEELSSELDAVAVARQIHDALRAPFFVDGREVTLTTSIGISFAHAARVGTGEMDADTLLRDADVALSRAKEGGRDRYEVFDEPMRRQLLDRITLEADLRAGLQRGELRLLFQPVVAVSDGGLTAVEALVRWEHPTRGLLAPGAFIGVAEESDLIVSLGEWVLDEACQQLRRWRDTHSAELGIRVSVNVSARQLTPALVETVEAALRRSGVDPSRLALEITESVLIEQTEQARELLAALKALGVAIVLDDFGTGYSSLGYLNQFPIDQLKLDRSFTSDLAVEPRTAKIVAATIEMARALGMTVVAEGVESSEQLEVLRRLGCDYAQGYLFAVPEPSDAIMERIRSAYARDSVIATPQRPPTRPIVDPLARARQLSEEERRSRQVATGRLSGWLFVVGGILSIPADLVMGAPSANAIILLTMMGVISGVICLSIPWDRVSSRWLHVIAPIGTVEVTISVLSVGRHASVLSSYYMLIAAAVAYAFSDRRAIAAHLTLISAALAFPLLFVANRTPNAVPRVIVSIPVLVLTACVIAYLRERMEQSAAELRELAARDPLTDVGNYRLLHERLDYELIRHEREQRPLAVLLIDLDRFKQVNERLGHAAGDDVLRRVAVTLREALRAQDTVARQGGDEFAVLAPGTDAEGAAMLAGRLRERLGRVQFAGDCVSATVGWAVFPEEGTTPHALLARADEALLEGKLIPRFAPAGINGRLVASQPSALPGV